ncbi:MAG: MBL fold metallo-hydrolase [Treponema sp.]|nr:MBL fold metallo-hydrolase [Treponema sp.]
MDRWYKCGKALLDEIAASQPQPGEAYVWFMGQHGFVINLAGMVFYIDVILNDFLDKDGKTSRVYPPPFEPGETQKVDYVLCTHNHSDHLNLKTLLPLAEANLRARFVVPAPCRRVLTEAGIGGDRVMAARTGERLTVKNGDSRSATIDPVPAIHTRYIQDEGEKDENGDYTSLGFVIKGDGISIYHSGDTWVTPSLVQTLKAHAPLNMAMLPINGSDWERTEGNCIGNMGALDAAKLARALPIDLVFPAHYDMMAYNSENPARFADSMYALCPEKRFHVCALGERFIYKRDSTGITR